MQQNESIGTSQLLEFINQCPFGLANANQKGDILLLNAEGSQLLLPISFDFEVPMTNILELIGAIDPVLKNDIESFDQEYGRICSIRRLTVNFTNSPKVQYIAFTVNRINRDSYQYSFADVTASVETEQRMREIAETTALQAGKLEMSTGILHDIGNAVTAFGTEVAKLNSDLQWREIRDLGKLIKLISSKSAALDDALGQGKGKALEKFIAALESSLKDRQQSYQTVGEQLYETTSHIQDILNIQRHYVKGKTKGSRAPIQLRSIIDDALAIQERSLLKRDIRIQKDIPLNLPPFEGDKTKMIQVVINILKNTAEAFDEVSDEREKSLTIRLRKVDKKGMLTLVIEDNAVGFAPQKGQSLTQKGKTSKSTGTGFGLYNCKQIVKTHNGKFSISSEGEGLGARVEIRLPYMEGGRPQKNDPILQNGSQANKQL